MKIDYKALCGSLAVCLASAMTPAQALLITVDHTQTEDMVETSAGQWTINSLLFVDDVLGTVGYNVGPFDSAGNNEVVIVNDHTLDLATEIQGHSIAGQAGLIDLGVDKGAGSWAFSGAGLTIRTAPGVVFTLDASGIADPSALLGQVSCIIRMSNLVPTRAITLQGFRIVATAPFPPAGCGQEAIIRISAAGEGAAHPRFKDMIFDTANRVVWEGLGAAVDCSTGIEFDHCIFRVIEDVAEHTFPCGNNHIIAYNNLGDAKRTGNLEIDNCTFIGDADRDWHVAQGNDYNAPDLYVTDTIVYNFGRWSHNVAHVPVELTRCIEFPNLPDGPGDETLEDLDPLLIDPTATIDDEFFGLIQPTSPAAMSNPADNIGWDIWTSSDGPTPNSARNWTVLN